MAPIARITALMLALASVLASASPILAPVPVGVSPSFVEAAAPVAPKVKITASAKIITSCTVKGVAALTFDDGPSSEHTPKLLDYLAKQKVKATFFINGDNVVQIKDPAVKKLVKKAYDAGHQIASHTWSHANLTNLAVPGIKEEMTKRKLEKVNVYAQTPVKCECR